ncbi:hypothetical protein [Thermaerobacillus caldiproteolyticus]|uniref:DUF5659 domain-containing protein n=1 Tax=Thermaerobacillus caldiproteolyticus TaxID=247480 RepID=A0A7W0BZK3_9BACL|nr:hypothetical protein [Anoxybacillus caldiproteolyticus]MBA2876876.1 hypothetical protein [Anoxybacillus caldiproteolyticus]
MKNYFFCYDLALKKKIDQYGIQYICTAIANSGKRFWLYERTEELQKILNER